MDVAPFPGAPLTAEELVRRIRLKGGRPLRAAAPPSVFVLTTDERLAGWLLDKGAREHAHYSRCRGGPTEWDIWIQPIPIRGEQTLWEVCS